MPHATQDMSRIALNPHPPTAAIPLLPPPQLTVDKLLIDGYPRRHPADRRHQALSVALSRCRKSQHPRIELLATSSQNLCANLNCNNLLTPPDRHAGATEQTPHTGQWSVQWSAVSSASP